MTKWKYTVWKFKHDAASHMVWNAIWAFKHLSKKKFLASCYWASYLAFLNDLLCGGEGKISLQREKKTFWILHSWNKVKKKRISGIEKFPPDTKIDKVRYFFLQIIFKEVWNFQWSKCRKLQEQALSLPAQTYLNFSDLSGPPRVSQSGVELEKNFECGFMASDDAYGSYKTYGKVRLKFGPP